MLATLLARFMAPKVAGWIADLLPFLAVAAVVWWVADLRATVARQKIELFGISEQLETERAARQRDIAGLTTLSKGLTAAAADTKKDQAAIVETINHENPEPASAGLAAFLDKLRANDGAINAPAARTGSGSAPAAGSAGAGK
jgi:hypothetical protein